jgi:hypothetical protein
MRMRIRGRPIKLALEKLDKAAVPIELREAFENFVRIVSASRKDPSAQTVRELINVGSMDEEKKLEAISLFDALDECLYSGSQADDTFKELRERILAFAHGWR